MQNLCCRMHEESKYYTEEQKVIIKLILSRIYSSRNLYFITGLAGTGKTFLLKELVTIFKYVLSLNVIVCASTGTAAKNIEGRTVHSMFHLEKDFVLSNLVVGHPDFDEIKNAEVIIIDEISMMNGQILDKIQNVIQSIQTQQEGLNESTTFSAFGGKLILLFGDMLQLPMIEEHMVGDKKFTFQHLLDNTLFSRFEW